VDDSFPRFAPQRNDIEAGLIEESPTSHSAAPQETARRFLAALESATDNLILVDAAWRIVFINKHARRSFGGGKGEVVGTSFWEFWPRKGSGPSRQMLIRSLEQQSWREFEDFFPELDLWFEIRAEPWEGGLALHLRDVTERHCAADELADSEARYRTIVEGAPDAIIAVDGRGFIDAFNHAACVLFGYPGHEAIGRHISLLLPRLGQFPFDDEGPPGPGRVEGRRRNGTRVALDLSVASMLRDHRRFHAMIAREADACARPPSEDRLRQTSRLELLGTLAGGILHDFNNLLLVMTNMAGLAVDAMAPASPAREPIDTLRQAVDRAEGMMRQLLGLYRQDAPRRERLHLAEAVSSALELLRASAPKRIAIHQRLDDAAEIIADPTQLCQLILNLGLNAAAAIGNRPGTIAVELSAAEAPPGLAAGRYARLTVHDDGVGMEPAVLARAFEPFFTTKPAGEGTGLGLAVVQGIVTESGGAITAESEPGVGSRINVYLPLAPA
jgi:PAS domain S-box-containing protein